jgi:non-homologous end joining protein Ku
MANPVELPSGKLFDLDRFVAILPNQNNQDLEYELILEGYPQPIKIESRDLLILKNKIKQQQENFENNRKQKQKNQNLMNLVKKWLEAKKDIVANPEDEKEYQNILANLLSNRI